MIEGTTREDISVPDNIREWLYRETGDLQSSYITKSNWWWDRHSDSPDFIYFYFRDKTVALKFKLTWGSSVVLP